MAGTTRALPIRTAFSDEAETAGQAEAMAALEIREAALASRNDFLFIFHLTKTISLPPQKCGRNGELDGSIFNPFSEKGCFSGGNCQMRENLPFGGGVCYIFRGMRGENSLKADMDAHDLQNALNELAARPVPKLPSNFEQGVWREIRSRKEVCRYESLWDWLAAPLLRPFGAVAMAVALLVSVGFGAIEALSSETVHAPLNLGVFSANAPALPSTLLARAR